MSRDLTIEAPTELLTAVIEHTRNYARLIEERAGREPEAQVRERLGERAAAVRESADRLADLRNAALNDRVGAEH